MLLNEGCMMKKDRICNGAGMFVCGILIWIIGRTIGVVAILMPLIAVVGFITMIVGLFERDEK